MALSKVVFPQTERELDWLSATAAKRIAETMNTQAERVGYSFNCNCEDEDICSSDCPRYLVQSVLDCGRTSVEVSNWIQGYFAGYAMALKIVEQMKGLTYGYDE